MKKFFIIIAVIFIAGFFSYKYILNSIADHLIFFQKPHKADVIIVLSGDDTGLRESYAARLYKEKYADKILVSGGIIGWNTTYADIIKKHLKHLGVSEKDIILESRSDSTLENAKFTYVIVKNLGFKSALLVTSSYHSARAYRLFNKIYKGDKISLTSCPVPPDIDWFKAKNWWTRAKDRKMVFFEILKNIYYF